MLLDRLLPDADASERHELEIPADPTVVYGALWEADLGGHPLIRMLLTIRSGPALRTKRRPLARRPITLPDILESGFRLLAEDEGHEVVIGVVGRFWRPTGALVPFDPERFTQPLAPGLAKAAWNFAVAPSAGGTLLSTETRVACADPASLRRFKAYWVVVRPFSGLIRRLMLRAVRGHVVAHGRRFPGGGGSR